MIDEVESIATNDNEGAVLVKEAEDDRQGIDVPRVVISAVDDFLAAVPLRLPSRLELVIRRWTPPFLPILGHLEWAICL